MRLVLRFDFYTTDELTILLHQHLLRHTMCDARGWAYISVAKKNRNFFPQGPDRDERKLSRYGRNVLRRDGRVVNVGGKRHRAIENYLRLAFCSPISY